MDVYVYIYFFFIFEIQPQKYSRKRWRGWAGSPSDGICYQGQWAAGQHPGYPSPLLPAYSRMGEAVEVGVQLGAGARSGGSGVRSWAEAGDRWGFPYAVICIIHRCGCGRLSRTLQPGIWERQAQGWPSLLTDDLPGSSIACHASL